MLKPILELLSKPYVALFYTLLLCFLLFSPSSNLVNVEPSFLVNDKVAHAMAFFGLGFLWKWYFKSYSKTFLILIVFAIFTEMVQYLLPESFSRSFELKDLLADSIGIVLGTLVSTWFKNLFSK